MDAEQSPQRFELGALAALVWNAVICALVPVVAWLVAGFRLASEGEDPPSLLWLVLGGAVPAEAVRRETVRQIAAGDLDPATSPAIVGASAWLAPVAWPLVTTLVGGSSHTFGLKVREAPGPTLWAAGVAVVLYAAIKLSARRGQRKGAA